MTLRLRCPEIVPPAAGSFTSILEARRSARALNPAPIREIANAVAFAARPRFVLDGDRFQRSRRLATSAGAIHPIEIIIVDWRSSERAMRYNAFEHSIDVLRIDCRKNIKKFREICGDLLPNAHGTALVLIADQLRADALYDNAISLIWRDAGSILETLALVSCAYRLGFCPLGTLGNQVVNALALCPEQAQGVGCAMIGRAGVALDHN